MWVLILTWEVWSTAVEEIYDDFAGLLEGILGCSYINKRDVLTLFLQLVGSLLHRHQEPQQKQSNIAPRWYEGRKICVVLMGGQNLVPLHSNLNTTL